MNLETQLFDVTLIHLQIKFQDQILDELIKLGRGMMDRGSEVIENKPSSTHTTELCSIVIDGSNIAMTFVSFLVARRTRVLIFNLHSSLLISMNI